MGSLGEEGVLGGVRGEEEGRGRAGHTHQVSGCQMQPWWRSAALLRLPQKVAPEHQQLDCNKVNA